MGQAKSTTNQFGGWTRLTDSPSVAPVSLVWSHLTNEERVLSRHGDILTPFCHYKSLFFQIESEYMSDFGPKRLLEENYRARVVFNDRVKNRRANSPKPPTLKHRSKRLVKRFSPASEPRHFSIWQNTIVDAEIVNRAGETSGRLERLSLTNNPVYSPSRTHFGLSILVKNLKVISPTQPTVAPSAFPTAG